jgi:hypothetical protein
MTISPESAMPQLQPGQYDISTLLQYDILTLPRQSVKVALTTRTAFQYTQRITTKATVTQYILGQSKV